MKWIIGVIGILFIALVFQLSLLAYAMYVMLGLLLLGRLLARNWTDHVAAARRFPDQAAEIGDRLDVAVLVRNDGSLPVPWVIAEDLLPREALRQRPPRLRVDGKRIKVGLVKRDGQLRVNYALVPDMRGFYRIGPVILEGGDLFGLFRRFRVSTEPHFLLVYPKMVPLLGYDLASRRPVGEIRLTHRLFEDPTRIAGVREYQQGDPLNRVHWKATARTGQLHCKLYEPSTIAGATLLLEFNQNSYHARGEPYRSELAITLAASLANALYHLGQPFGLVSNGRDAADRLRAEGWKVPSGGGVYRSRQEAEAVVSEETSDGRLQPVIVRLGKNEEQLQTIREALARLELNDGLTFAELVRESASQLSRQATIVAILPAVSVGTAMTLANLKQSGYAVAAILVSLDELDHAEHYARLAGEGIDVRALQDEAGIASLCQNLMAR